VHIAIADDYQNCVKDLKCFSTLKGNEISIYVEPTKDKAQLIQRFINADIIVVVRERITIDEELLKSLPKLKLIALVGRNSKFIDYAACTKYGVAVTHGEASSHLAPAECTLALMLAARRNIVLEAARMKAGLFPITLSHRLNGSTLGIFGLGEIGEVVAKAAQGLGMHILVWGRKALLSVQKNWDLR